MLITTSRHDPQARPFRVEKLTYHRFWAQADVAMAYADYGNLFPNG